jgi:hypothetical protein
LSSKRKTPPWFQNLRVNFFSIYPPMPLPPSSTSLSGDPKSFAYRPDIDGLRAIAVLGVVFFHAGLGFPGGYVGVDVFFVISGFLITSLLLKDLRRGTFSLLDFWERRARRILPALSGRRHFDHHCRVVPVAACRL